MKVITYLGFTVLSVFIQFCVMDLIQERRQINVKSFDSNVTSQKKELIDLIKDISSKPHALYYRTHIRSLKKPNLMLANVSTEIYNNLSLPEVPLSTTYMPGTYLDVLYDDNTSVTETGYTTDPFATSTEFDNVTEITFLEKKNKSSDVLHEKPKIQFSKDCGCNFLYQVCDVNCCCDKDCTDDEHNIFDCDEQGKKYKISKGKRYNCISQGDGEIFGSNLFDNLFCIVKTNLPDKRTIKTYDLKLAEEYYKWKNIDHPKTFYEFRKSLYTHNDPMWLLNNKTFYYLDMATPLINDYCNDRTPMKFLKDETIKCKVKLKDLEMFHILRTSEDARIISATEKTLNTSSSALNCSNLHCINWTIMSCNNEICSNYDKNVNDASCTESRCSNLALKIDYNFYYYDSKIINATVKLHIQNIANILPFMSQEINVKFFMTNKSEERIVRLSGSPGYIVGRPIIVSHFESNYTEHFYNNNSNGNNFLTIPENKNGICSFLNVSRNVVMFGLNKRTKCRYFYGDIKSNKNNTNVCNNIQESINELMGLNNTVAVAPFGNPYGLTDEDWIKLQIAMSPEEPVYGEYNEISSKLYCRNLITRFSLIFAIANGNGTSAAENKIVNTKYGVTMKNVSFNIEDISIVITIDTNFIDVSKPHSYDYAGGPNLNIHLPNDFFLPFPSNKSQYVYNSYNIKLLVTLLLMCNNVLFLQIK